MRKLFCTAFFCFFFAPFCTNAQTWSDNETIPWLASRIKILADTAMHGRGYVKNGRNRAAAYIQKQFKAYHLKPVGPSGSYLQHYYFPVNTFPGKMDLVLDGQMLEAGKDYIIDAKSAAYTAENRTVEHIDVATITSKKQWDKLLLTLNNPKKIFYLEHVDSACKMMGMRKALLVSGLPKGCFIIPQKEKFIWTVTRVAMKATVFYVKADAATAGAGKATVHVQTKLVPNVKNDNIVGMLPGDVKDSFVVFTAHYDHLGMMGSKAVFPGASDNASGTSMLLYLANYFHTHPQHYSVLFIAFSGEEAGLMGSKYFTQHPLLKLKKIKFLTNVDIMGDASDGITVVNATEYPKHFKMLQDLNERNNYSLQIMSRGKAANSDHYHFSEAGVPSFFIYTNGGKGYYHDIYDRAEELSLNQVDKIAQLLKDFITEIR